MPALTRRHLLQGLTALSAGAYSLPGLSNTWRNWSGNQHATPQRIIYAQDEAQISDALRQAKNLRVVGGSHSFSALVPSSDTLLSLEPMNGLVAHDAAQHQATFWAGSRLAQVSSESAKLGQSLINEPDINVQSLGGTISTATHGTGGQLKCLSANVEKIRLFTAEGLPLECSTSAHPEIFRAAQVGLGCLGVMTQITLQNEPLYKLKETVQVCSLEEAVSTVEAERLQHRHVEFWGFVDGGKAIIKRQMLTDEPDTPPLTSSIDENELLEFVADTAQKLPWLNSTLQRLVGVFVEESTRVGPSWQIFPSPRTVAFNEMEYQIPLEHGFACFNELTEAMRNSDIQVFFPLEFRFVQADELWLSPFSGQDCVSISIHQYAQQDYQALFALAEPILRKYGGRPHWGKWHSLTSKELTPLYPHWQDFLTVREALDPQGKFLTPYLRNLLGVA